MSPRLLVTSVIGGVVLFIWGAFSHMVLPLGEVGIQELANEDAVLPTLKANISEAGLYYFPGYGIGDKDMSPEESQAAMIRWEEKHLTGPAGFMVIDPHGQPTMTSGQLVTELVTDIIAALLAALLLVKAASSIPTFGTKVLFCTMLGLFASIYIDVQYWNWYSFPTDYTIAQLADQIIGFTLVGMVLAWRMKPAQA